MIFVTVGTHEQPFNRLLKCIDKMVKEGIIKEKVIIQKGYTDYEPKYCESYKLISYDSMKQYIKEARIVITHGGPASFIAPLTIGKIPIVVPRQYKYHEHVNDHQLEFAREVKKRKNNILLVENEEELIDSIVNYEKKIKNIAREKCSNNEKFNTKLKDLVKNMFESENKHG